MPKKANQAKQAHKSTQPKKKSKRNLKSKLHMKQIEQLLEEIKKRAASSDSSSDSSSSSSSPDTSDSEIIIASPTPPSPSPPPPSPNPPLTHTSRSIEPKNIQAASDNSHKTADSNPNHPLTHTSRMVEPKSNQAASNINHKTADSNVELILNNDIIFNDPNDPPLEPSSPSPKEVFLEVLGICELLTNGRQKKQSTRGICKFFNSPEGCRRNPTNEIKSCTTGTLSWRHNCLLCRLILYQWSNHSINNCMIYKYCVRLNLVTEVTEFLNSIKLN